jgi:hypothetical protein
VKLVHWPASGLSFSPGNGQLLDAARVRIGTLAPTTFAGRGRSRGFDCGNLANIRRLTFGLFDASSRLVRSIAGPTDTQEPVARITDARGAEVATLFPPPRSRRDGSIRVVVHGHEIGRLSPDMSELQFLGPDQRECIAHVRSSGISLFHVYRIQSSDALDDPLTCTAVTAAPCRRMDTSQSWGAP